MCGACFAAKSPPRETTILATKVPDRLSLVQLKEAGLSPGFFSPHRILQLRAGDSIIITLKRGELMLRTKFGLGYEDTKMNMNTLLCFRGAHSSVEEYIRNCIAGKMAEVLNSTKCSRSRANGV